VPHARRRRFGRKSDRDRAQTWLGLELSLTFHFSRRLLHDQALAESSPASSEPKYVVHAARPARQVGKAGHKPRPHSGGRGVLCCVDGSLQPSSLQGIPDAGPRMVWSLRPY
jgi:hypothetical protein